MLHGKSVIWRPKRPNTRTLHSVTQISLHMALNSAQPKETYSSDTEKIDERDWPDFVCGAGAAATNIIVTFPAYKVMFRQQVEGVRFRKALRQVLREGLSNIYRGVFPPLMQKGTSLAIMFGSYNKFQKDLSRKLTNIPSVVTNASAAVIAGSLEAILTPFERVQTLLTHRGHNERFLNTFHVFKVLGKQYGFREYYRGLTPILMRNGPSNVLFFGLRGPIKSALPETKTAIGNAASNFVSGAVLGACLSTFFFPINVIKSHMQKQLGGEFVSFPKAFLTVFGERKRSVRRLFYGVSLNYTRALVSWGVINCSYEMLKSWMHHEHAVV
ncbi:mitochondrial nicotinamide adenine dinucleotide transporter SLC25A51-like [Montipora capricornis]|uniref:mitochondrial nicotinamide adenine dinucleotide transporter SLC25A51-like n=1 Tax=Montipora capricornis TaxID=246305 RepID=UPI0035F14D4D